MRPRGQCLRHSLVSGKQTHSPREEGTSGECSPGGKRQSITSASWNPAPPLPTKCLITMAAADPGAGRSGCVDSGLPTAPGQPGQVAGGSHKEKAFNLRPSKASYSSQQAGHPGQRESAAKETFSGKSLSPKEPWELLHRHWHQIWGQIWGL